MVKKERTIEICVGTGCDQFLPDRPIVVTHRGTTYRFCSGICALSVFRDSLREIEKDLGLLIQQVS